MRTLIVLLLLAPMAPAFADDAKPATALTDLDTAKLQVASLQSANIALQAKVAGLEKTVAELQARIAEAFVNPVFTAVCEAAKIPVAECTTSPDGKSVQKRPK